MALAAVSASAAEVPSAGPAMREVPVAADAFLRGTPVPAWVQRQPLPPTQRKEPVVMRLRDTQVRIDETVTTFVEWSAQANSSTALGEIGQVAVEFNPQYQRLRLHSLQLLRGGTVLDRTLSADVRFLERETGFERGVYSGVVTVALLIPDVRVGDTLSLVYSVEGVNPVFGGLYFDDFGWDGPWPVEQRRIRVTHPESRPLHWRMLGEYRVGGIEPEIKISGGMRTLSFEERGIEPLADEPLVPGDYFKWRRLQVSEFGDWNRVARWAAAMFPPVEALPAELEALLKTLSALPTAQDRVAAATRWVQSEIRNFSLSFGESSHRPHAPAFVLDKRYGDCKDKTYLLLTLLRRLDIEATPLLVSLQAPRAPAKVLPSPWPFDHVVVQARVAGRTVFLEPTSVPQTADLASIGQPPPWMVGLRVSESTTAPAVLGDAATSEAPTLDVEERFGFAQLGTDGTLEVRQVMNQGFAELFRAAWPQMSAEQRRQVALADYEKRWPGIQLVGEPQPIDDLLLNRFGYTARFSVPKLAQPHQGGWLMRYPATALQGLLSLPPSLQRKFPLRAIDHPMERRQLVSVQWPAQVSATSDPSTQSMDGRLFRVEARTSFRGSRYEFRLRLSTKARDIAAADLPILLQDLQRLDGLIPGRVVVDKVMIRQADSAVAPSAAESMRRKLQEAIDQAAGAIRSGLPKGDDLARLHCARALTLAEVERQVEARADAAEALRLAPQLADAWACQGKVLLFGGDFAAADAALTRALALPKPTLTKPWFDRGVARFFLGQWQAAVADFAQSALPDEDGDSDLFARAWQVAALRRAGLPLPADALAAARQDPRGAWPRPALAMLAGQVTPQALLAELDTLQGEERALTLSEAWFFIGQRHLIDKQPDAARDAFEKCQALGITSYYEHVAAGFELARLSRR
jgi:transglutaminase-like putative cysteine protease/lipoprotein NlpI